MKRFYFWFAALVLLFALCSCREMGNPNIYDVTHDGLTFTVDQEQGTITCDGVIYRFEVSGGGNRVDLHITYPDGSTYWWTEQGYSAWGGWSDNYAPEENGYVPGDVLRDVLGIRPVSHRSSGPSPLLAILLLAFGAFLVIAPRAMWTLEYGWHFKSAEPSDLALAFNRVLGVLLIFVGIICLLASI